MPVNLLRHADWVVPALLLMVVAWIGLESGLWPEWDHLLAGMALLALIGAAWVRWAEPGSASSNTAADDSSGLAAGLRLAPTVFLQWVLGSLVILGLYYLTVTTVLYMKLVAAPGSDTPFPVFEQALRQYDDVVVIALVSSAVAVAVWSLIRFQTKAREAALRDRQLALAELAVLRAQIEPHFLWNTLANLQYLIRRDPATASGMMGHLITYMKSCVTQGHQHLSSVQQEMASARAYVELMKMRMGPRLEVEYEVATAAEDCMIPTFVLHTLIENAFKHGLEPKVGECRLSITVQRQNGRLELVVTDNGVGLRDEAPTQGTRLGLSNTGKRLQSIYGDQASIRLTAAAEGGAVARVSLPAVAA